MRLRLGGVQRDAVAIFVFGRGECLLDDEAPFPGTLDESALTVEDGSGEVACSVLADAANSADDSGWVEHREALERLQRRVRQGR